MTGSNCPTYPKIETLFDRDEKFHVDTNRLRCPEFGLIKDWLVTEKIDGTNIRVSLEADPVFEEVTTYDEIGPSPAIRQVGFDWKVRFNGRTDNAQIPTFLLSYLQDTFTLDKMQNLWRGKPKCEKCGGTGQFDSGEPKPLTGSYPGHRDYQCDCVEPYPITLYGEGYGARIQKGGGNYREGVSFRLFDVLVDGKWWLGWSNVCDVAEKLGIKTVPVLLLGRHLPLSPFVNLVQRGFTSYVAAEERNHSHPAEGIVARTDPYLFDKHGHPLRFKLKSRDFPSEAQ